MHNEILIVLVSDGALPRALEPDKIVIRPTYDNGAGRQVTGMMR